MSDEFVNAGSGGHAILADVKKRHWWNHYLFPLVPQYEYRPANENNPSGFYFSWLGIRVWNMDSPLQFAIEFRISKDGICFAGSLPYIRWWLWLLPLPDFIVHKIFWFGHRHGTSGKWWEHHDNSEIL